MWNRLAKMKERPRGGVREMVAIALPMVVSSACDTVMIFTDRLFLARLDPQLMSAAMGGGITVFMLMSFFLGLIGYTTALTAQYLGAGQKKKCPLVLSQAVLLALAAYPVVLTLRPLGHRLFEFMGIGAGQIGPQNLYFDILLYGTLISLWRQALSSFFSGIGRTGVVMVASAATMVVNVGMNYVLIYGKLGFPALGIAGAAYATVLSGVCGLSILVSAYLRKRLRQEFDIARSLRFDGAVLGRLFRFGSSVGLEMFLNIMAFNTVVMIFHSCGAAVATAATVVFNWDMVSFVPLIGIEIGVTSLVGRSMGGGDPATAHRSVMSGLKMGLVYSAVIFLLFVGFPAQLVYLFRPAAASEIFQQAMPVAAFMVRLASIYVLVEAMFVVFVGALRGAGDTWWAMCMSVSLHWMMVGVVWTALKRGGASPQFAWGAMIAVFLLFSLLVVRRYFGGAWKKIRVVAPEPISLADEAFHEPRDL